MLRKCFIIAVAVVGSLSGCGDAPESYGAGSGNSTAGNPFVANSTESDPADDEVVAGEQAEPTPTPTPTPTPKPTPTPQIYSNLVIDDFLWKPESESDGNVAVLVNPFNISAEVTGDVSENLRNH